MSVDAFSVDKVWLWIFLILTTLWNKMNLNTREMEYKMKNQNSEKKKESYIHEEIYAKTINLRKKYLQRSRKTLFSFIFWLFKQLLLSFFQRQKQNDIAEKTIAEENGSHLSNNNKDNLSNNKKNNLSNNEKDNLSVLFYLTGGLGDVIIAAPCLYELVKVIESNIILTIVTDQNVNAVQGVFHGYNFIKEIITHDEEKSRGNCWDACIRIARFPSVLYRSERIKRKAPVFDSFLDDYDNFNKKYGYLCQNKASNDAMGVMYALMNGHSRRTQMDLNHRLQMSEETPTVMLLDKNSFNIFSRYELKGKKYLTFQRGVNENYKEHVNIRVWPRYYYEILLHKIKSEFPEFTLVQIGKKNSEPALNGIDFDLRSQTTFEELKVILKYSSLHIDGECGMVHLNHALSGCSAVFFGQTRIDFCGYPENINVKAENACPLWCECITNDWENQCLRGFDQPPCMEKLTPDFFYQAIHEHLQKILLPAATWEWQETKEIFDPPNNVVFVGDFSEEEILSFRPDLHGILHVSDNMTTENIHRVKKNGYVAELGNVLNLPIKNDWADLVFYKGDYGEYEMLELKRITKPEGMLVCNQLQWKKVIQRER